MAIFNNIKEKFKKMTKEQTSLNIFERIAQKVKTFSGKKEVSRRTEKEVLGIQEMAVETTKFHTAQTYQPAIRRFPQDLPFGYGRDKIVLQVRDPWWIHAYWEVTQETFERLKIELGVTFYSAKKVLRVYDISNIIFDGKNAHRFFDIEVTAEATNWYIDTAGPGRSWCVDLGLRLTNGDFIIILRSNVVHTPLEGPSWIMDEEWLVPEDFFARLYGMGFGFGRSSPVGKGWQERIKKGFFSSPGIASMASPVKKMPAGKNFWLKLDTELIVYGATEPDAKVTVQNRPIKLRPDGTFSLRFALPDGKQIIPVAATSCDDAETKTITPIVTKETR